MHEGFLRGQNIFERYKIISQLGAGGFGAVFKAEQVTTQQKVAIKVLIAGTCEAQEIRKEQQKRFWREVSLTGKLSNPHTVRLIDSGFMTGSEWQGLLDSGQVKDEVALKTIQRFVGEDAPVMVLELVQGQSLREVIAREGSMSPSRARRICGHILESLAEAHAVGIVHRDLKPENVMIVGSGKLVSAKVLDFGISGVIDSASDATSPNQTGAQIEAITKQGQVRGTPSYMAPEQMVLFSQPRIETDIYALGLILLECLTGRQVVTGTSSMDICRKQMQEDPEIPQFIWDSGLGEVITKATHKDPDLRFTSAEAMFSAIHVDDDAAADKSLDLPRLNINKSIPRHLALNESISQSQPLAGDMQSGKSHPYLKLTISSLVIALAVGIAILIYMFRDVNGSTIRTAEAIQPLTPTQPTTAPPSPPPVAAPIKEPSAEVYPAADDLDHPQPAPDADIASLLDLGNSAYIAGLTDDAQRHFNAALAAHAHHPDALVGLARCASTLQDWPAATRYFQKAIVESKDPVPVILELSELLKKQGQVDEAKTLIERYLKTFPQHPRAQALQDQLASLNDVAPAASNKGDQDVKNKPPTKNTSNTSSTKIKTTNNADKTDKDKADKVDHKEPPAPTNTSTNTPGLTPINTGVSAID